MPPTTPTAEQAAALELLQQRAAALSRARDLLTAATARLRADLERVRDAALPEIHQMARDYSAHHADLAALIEAHPHLFDRPRTQVVDGIKFGLQKSKESLAYDGEPELIARIHKLTRAGHIPADLECVLITTEESISKTALAKVDPVILARLGVEVVPGTDQVLIGRVDDGVEKAVNALIKKSLGAREEVTE